MIDKIEYGNRSKAMNKLRVPPLGTQSLDWSSLIGGWLMGIILVCLLVAFVMRESNRHTSKELYAYAIIMQLVFD